MSSALQLSIDRGMDRYWSHWFDFMANDVERQKKRYRECQRDKELLRGLVEQNTELEELIDEAGRPK